MAERLENLKDPVWERQDGETSAQHKAFIAYRDLGPGRTISQAHGQGGKEATSKFFDWSAQNRWIDRAEAWDDHGQRQKDLEFERQAQETASKWAKRREESRERAYMTARLAIAKIGTRISKLTAETFDTRVMRDLAESLNKFVAIEATAILDGCSDLPAGD